MQTTCPCRLLLVTTPALIITTMSSLPPASFENRHFLAAHVDDTLRFYERSGLITPPRRLANGYRDYDEHTLAELKFELLP